jgi:group II intron reverse transcriptase/maturase
MTDPTFAKNQPIGKRQVWEAWKHVRGGGKSTGVDGLSMDAIASDPGRYLYPLWNRMASGSYMPPPVREKRIPKGDGKERKLGIPTILDRVAQQVIRAELEEEVEPRFHPDSYGYRPGRSAHDALKQCHARCRGSWYVIDLDIRAFFDTIDHETMLSVLRKHTDKKHILLYCERWLKAPMMKEDGTLEARDRGTPQGGVISPLLANLYLHEAFDLWLWETEPEVEFERYADDIVVHVTSREQAHRLLNRIRERLGEFSLSLSEEKTKIVYCWKGTRPTDVGEGCDRSFDFLGFTFRPRYMAKRAGKGGGLWIFSPGISHKSEKRITATLRELRIFRWQSLTLAEVSRELAPMIRGWLGYYSLYCPSGMNGLWWRLNMRLIKWARRKFSLATLGAAFVRIQRICREQPHLFPHWSRGFTI